MNSDAQARYAARAAATASLGVDGVRRASLPRLALKTVVKEAHAQPVRVLEFSPHAATGNLFATVGKDQATVYDDDHFGDYVAVVAQFDSVGTEHAPGGDLAALAWIAPPTSHPDDARVAVAGDAGAVSVISVADCAVVALARGHASPVVDLAGAPRLLGAVASLDRGGSVALWRVGAARAACAAALAVGDATVLALAPDGSFLLTGHKSGAVQRWSLDGLWGEEEGEGDASTAESLPAPTPATPTPVTPAGARRALDAPVTAMRMLTPTSVAVLGADGRGAVLDLDTTNTTTSLRCSFRAPGARLLGGSGGGCRLASTRDGALLAVGGPAGEAAVLDSATGKAIISLPPPPRVKAAARAVGVSDDGRHVLVAAGGGFIFRQEARPVEGEESGGGKDNEGGGD